jgi:hypothetical protein
MLLTWKVRVEIFRQGLDEDMVALRMPSVTSG